MAQILYPDVTQTHDSPQMTLGDIVRTVDSEGMKEYQYVLWNDGDGLTAAAGLVAYYLVGANALLSTITTDVSASDVNHVAGVMLSVPTDGQYCFIQKRGYYATVKTNADDDISAGDALIGVGDGTCDSVAQDTAPTNKVLGWATADDVDAADTVAARLECL